MTPEIRHCIHAFHNALVLAADTRSKESFRIDRRKELNEFPLGCRRLVSQFLTQYLQDSDPTLQPVIMRLQASSEFREAFHSTIESYAIVELTGWFLDLTLNQLPEYHHRV